MAEVTLNDLRQQDDLKVKIRSEVRTGLNSAEFDLDERRVARYLLELTKGEIGVGVDPVGFLIASHASLVETIKANKTTT